jgi:hypothetical protein
MSWFRNVYFPNVGEKTLLLVDSWNGYKAEDVVNLTPPNKQCTLKILPQAYYWLHSAIRCLWLPNMEELRASIFGHGSFDAN